MVAMVSYAAGASPLMTRHTPPDSFSLQTSLLHRVVIYAKEGSTKLIDGRWNLGQSEAKLGLKLSPDETKQLMACTGRIVCQQPWGEVFASASSVLRPDLLVTAKHVFAKVRGGPVSIGSCSFRSFLHRRTAIPVVVEKDQRTGYFLNNEDFIVVRLKRDVPDCTPLAVAAVDSSLSEGEEIFSATGYQLRALNRLSDREPVLAKGTVRGVFNPYLGGVPFYSTDIDLDKGGSGGAIFALKDGRAVADDEGRLILRGILVAHGPRAKSGKPFSEEQNYTIINGLQAAFRELVKGKAQKSAAMTPAPCFPGETAKIEVLSEPVPSPQSLALTPLLQQNTCKRETAPGRDASKNGADCLAHELKEIVKGIETLAVARRGKEKLEFRLRNGTSCPVCFTYNRCNDYGCWDETVMASAKSTLFAGAGERAPTIRNPQFCMLARAPAYVHPTLPHRNPERTLIGVIDSRQRTVAPEALFLTAKEKARRDGVWTLTEEDIRGLSLEQIRELRGY
ncbi:MAG: trypsin-like peptidase domain-containing protein [Alphaproteobacteria bacterium]|nr:trypsin-like peptidase domain-containing protein [Alphaproteobacteria bacterium]